MNSKHSCSVSFSTYQTDMPEAPLDLPPVLRDAFASGKIFSPEGLQTDLQSNVSEQEARCLYEAVRELQPASSLEVGFAQGISATAILAAIRANGRGHHHIMDPFQANYGDCGLETVRRAGLGDQMTFHRKFAEEVIPGLPSVDFSFIDASHLFDLTLSEFVLTDKKLRVGGVVAFHDMWMPSQQALIRYIVSNRAYQVFWPKSSPANQVPPSSPVIQRAIRAVCRSLPGAERIFSKEFLNPWSNLNLGNLVFLQKTADDKRDWRFHAAF